MKTTTTILSGGKAKELFSQLNKKEPHIIAVARSNYANITFMLRYCYVTKHTGYERKSFAYKTERTATGGMLLSWDAEGLPPGFSILKGGRVRIKKDSEDKQLKAVSRAIARIVLATHKERNRVWWIQKVDSMCKPFESDKKFQKFVEQWEKKDGRPSEYIKLTVKDCQAWIDRLSKYTTKNP